MDGYIFKNMNNDEYGILAPDVWQKLFKMFELKQIMRQLSLQVHSLLLADPSQCILCENNFH